MPSSYDIINKGSIGVRAQKNRARNHTPCSKSDDFQLYQFATS